MVDGGLAEHLGRIDGVVERNSEEEFVLASFPEAFLVNHVVDYFEFHKFSLLEELQRRVLWQVQKGKVFLKTNFSW